VRNFFPLSRGDLGYLIIVLGCALVAFLPWARGIHFLGVALVGWLMAALMVVAPLVALARVMREPRGTESSREDS